MTAEVDVELGVAEGTLPAGLRGVLYRNGPGTNASFGHPYAHPFDGDGHVVRFAFDGARVRYSNRFVETRERAQEAMAGRPLFRSFGTNLPGGIGANIGRLRFKNAANTSVVFHGQKLLALWEGGLPHRLDPATLVTLARDDLGGRLLNRVSPLHRLLAPELPFSAHPKVDPTTGELFNFGALLGPRPALVLYRADRAGRFDPPGLVPLERLVFVHDFILTPRYRVFFLVPVAFRVARALSGFSSPADAIASVDGEPTQILLVPRGPGAPVRVLADPCFIFHFVSGHDTADGRVEVIGMRMPSFPSTRLTRALFEGRAVDFPSALPTRYVIDPRLQTVREERLSEAAAELPTIDPSLVGQPVRSFWSIAGTAGAADPFLKHVQRFDLEEGAAPVVRDFSPDLPGEPLFVPSEDGGLVLVLVYRTHAHRSDLYVLRAEDLALVCRLELPHHVPPGFHGTWVAAGEAGLEVTATS